VASLLHVAILVLGPALPYAGPFFMVSALNAIGRIPEAWQSVSPAVNHAENLRTR
jgi:hypothetical protein